VLAILGPSGCGKSTLLRVIAGIMPPDSGQVLYDGVPISEIERQDRNIGMVFQEGALVPHWESRRSVGFFLALRKRTEEIPKRVHDIASITGFGLDRLLDRRPGQLSGGEKQRVAIARALTRDLNILLMDEPFANIDAKLRAQARVELKRLMMAFPVTSVYVTHDQLEAVALARRVAVMDAGRIVQVGSYEALYERPVNQFVAEFIGTQPINLLRGFVIDGAWKGDSFAGFPMRRDLPEGMRVTLGVRPERIQLVQGETAYPTAEGVVMTVTPYYAEQYQLVEVRGNGETWLLHAPPELPLKRKDRVQCAIAPEAVLFFDTDGVRIG
jgi:ABC-type sugar transport system ATPase subunit